MKQSVFVEIKEPALLFAKICECNWEKDAKCKMQKPNHAFRVNIHSIET